MSRAKKQHRVNAVMFLVEKHPTADVQEAVIRQLARDGRKLERLGVAIDLGPYPARKVRR